MSGPELILIEFNELSPTLLRQFMDAGELPNFRSFYEASTVYTTDAEEEGAALEPWVQWPTVHSGLRYSEHGVLKLGEGRRLTEPGIAQLLADRGIRVGVMGSMNTNYGELDGFVVPDPWDPVGKATPAFLQPYFESVAGQVQESSRDGGDSRADLVKLGVFLARHGLSFGTARRAALQLLAERRDRGVKWRRGMLLDSLQYDLFRYLCKRTDVGFATFFSNSTAHLMHYYWRDMQPDAFDVKPPADNHQSLRSAVLDGYRAMDGLLARFTRDFPNSLLVFCTALSQQPWREATKCTFRPRDFNEFLSFAGVDLSAVSVYPVMAEQFRVVCTSETEAEAVRQKLLGLSCGEQPLMTARCDGVQVFTGCRLHEPVAAGQTVGGPNGTRPFDDLFHMVSTMRSGKHHPDGALWIRNHHHQVVPEKVALRRVAPTVLQKFDVPIPPRMTGEPLPI